MDTRDLQELLEPWDWQVEFDARTLSRAGDYCRSGRVRTLRHTEGDGEDVLTGTVQGTRAKPYTCTVRIRCDADSPELDTDCSCPVGWHCKHAAAVLMVATTTPPEGWPGPGARSTTSPRSTVPPVPAPAPVPLPVPAVEPLFEWTRWLRGIETPGAEIDARTAERGRQFGLLLRAGSHVTYPSLQVSPVWLRQSRSKTSAHAGKLVDPQPARLDPHGPVPEPLDGWPADVAGALTVLMHGQ
ncbi:MAG: SWIM zinc finger family protein, partial [Terracidiphilus sp.]